MKDRIREVRASVNLTQQKFADRIKVNRSAVAQYEMGRNPPSDAVITLICREFGVDEVWLRTGAGEPFPPRSRRDVIDDYLGELSEGKRSDIEQLLIEFMAETPVEEWEVLNGMLKRLAGKVNGEH